MRTFQDLRRQRQNEAFVGRDNEALSFEENLRMPLDDPRRRFLVAISGQGGMGKTTFMERCREISQAAGVATAWSDEAEATVVDVMAQFASELGEAGDFNAFSEDLKTYRERRLELEGKTNAPPEFARLAADIVGRGGTKLARRIPVAGAALDFVDEDAVGSQLSEVVTYVLQHTKKREEAQLILQPLQVLTPKFLEGLASVMDSHPVALFFDTFEDTRHSVEPWLLSLLSGDFGEFPLNLLVVVAGRYPPNPQTWTPFESLIQHFELQPLVDEEMRSFLNRKAIKGTAADEIIRICQGIPILLASLAIGNPEDPQASDTVVERILQSAPEDLRSASIKAAIPRTLNLDIARLILGEESANTSLDWILDTPFVSGSNTGWKYHDVIRREFVRYAKRQSPDEWKETHELLATYYDDHRRDAVASDDDMVVIYDSEYVYHSVCAGERKVLDSAVARCLRLWRADPRFGRPLGIAIRDGERDADVPVESGWGEQIVEAVDEFDEGRDAEVFALLTRAMGASSLSVKAKRDALAVRSDLYRRQGRLNLALADIDEAIGLDGSEAGLFYDRAWIHMQSEQPSLAFADCEQALLLVSVDDRRHQIYDVMRIRLLKELVDPNEALSQCNQVIENTKHPWAFLIRGQIYRSLEDIPKAVDDFLRSVELQPSRRHQAWKEIAIAHLEVDDFEKAEEALRESLASAPKCDHCWELLGATYAETREAEDCELALRSVCNEVSDEDVRPYRALGFLQAGLADEACKELERAVANEPARAEFRLWLAEANESAERWEPVEAQVDEALRLRPGWSAATVLKARCRFHYDDHEAAEKVWAEVEAADPREMNLGDLASRGLGLSILGMYGRAIKFYDQVLEMNQVVEIQYNRAIAQSLDPEFRGDWKRDIAIAMAALESMDQGVVRSYGLAGLHASLNEETVAYQLLEEAIRLDAEVAIGWARFDPAFKPLRGSKRFDELIELV